MKNLLLSVCMLAAGAAFAGNVTWTGAVNSNWSEPGNWKDATDASGLPTTADVAVFNVAEPTTINVDTETAICNQVKIEAASAAVTFGGTGLLTVSMSTADGLNEQAQTKVAILNLNCTHAFTTFDCRYHTSATGKVAFGPGCIYNNDVTTASVYAMFGGIKSVTPGDDYKKSIFKAGFDYVGTSTSRQVLVGLSETHELVIDNGASGKTFKCYETFTFSINNGTGATSGRMTLKSGLVTVSGTMKHASTGTSAIFVEGGVFKAGAVDANLRGHIQVSGDGEFSYSKNMAAGGQAQLPDFLWDDESVFVGAGYRLRPVANCTIFRNGDDPTHFYLDGILELVNHTSNQNILSLNVPWTSLPAVDGRGTGEIIADILNVYGPTVLKNLKLSVGQTFASNSEGGVLHFENDTIQMYGDLPDYAAKGQYFYFEGTNTIDTLDCKDGTTTRTAVFKCSCFEDPTASLTVKGGGTVTFDNQYWPSSHASGKFIGKALAVQGAGTKAQFLYSAGIQASESLLVGAGATLSVDGGSVATDKLVLGDGATLNLAFSTSAVAALSAKSVVQEGAVTLNVTVPAGTADAAYPFVGGIDLDPARTTVNLTDASGRSFTTRYTDKGIYLAPGSIVPTADHEWTGAKNGNWNDADNWTALPSAGDHLFVSGFGNLAMNNNFAAGTQFGSITFRETAGPFVVAGNGLVLTNGVTNKSTPVTIESGFRGVETFDCDVSFAHKTAVVKASNGGSIRFNGKLRTTDGSYTDHLYLFGNVQFGGDAVVHKIMPNQGSTVQVLNGGRLTITNQTNLSAQNLGQGTLVVDAGGVFDWAASNDKPFYWTVAHTHTVNGQMIIGTSYGAGDGKVQTFTGTGRLDIARYNYLKGQTLPLTGGVHLNNRSDFLTANTNGAVECATITLTDSVLGALADWTYGPGPLVTDASSLGTTPSDRALKFIGTLTVDTENPDTSVGHTITCVDPISGEGVLVKDGEGTLRLESSENVIGGLALKGGDLQLETPLATGTLKFDGGGILIPKSKRGSYADWATLVTAASIEGDPVETSGKYELRVVDGEGDTKLLQAKYNAKGLLLIFR